MSAADCGVPSEIVTVLSLTGLSQCFPNFFFSGHRQINYRSLVISALLVTLLKLHSV